MDCNTQSVKTKDSVMLEVKDMPANQTSEVAAPNFGDGRYSRLAKTSFEQIQVVFPDVSVKDAEKIARQIASDFGAAIKHSVVDAKIGKSINGDGKVSISEACKAKGVTVTNALRVMHTLNFVADAGKFGLSWKFSKFIPIADGDLQKALNDLCD